MVDETKLQDLLIEKVFVIRVITGIKYDISPNHAKIKLIHVIICPWKTFTIFNVIIHIEQVWNKDTNNYYNNILLEKGTYH